MPEARLTVAPKLKEHPVAIDEIERTALVNQLITTLGEESAATLMKCVLPGGADRVATKDDIAAVREEIRLVEERMRAHVDSAIAKQTRTMMLSMTGIMVALLTPLYAGLLG